MFLHKCFCQLGLYRYVPLQLHKPNYGKWLGLLCPFVLYRQQNKYHHQHHNTELFFLHFPSFSFLGIGLMIVSIDIEP